MKIVNECTGRRQIECWTERERRKRRREGMGMERGHAIIKEGKAFAVLFGDLTSHYPISPGPSLTPRSATKDRASSGGSSCG